MRWDRDGTRGDTQSESSIAPPNKFGGGIKIPNITALSNISFSTILTNIFAKQKSFLFSYFVNLDKKSSEWYYSMRKSWVF